MGQEAVTSCFKKKQVRNIKFTLQAEIVVCWNREKIKTIIVSIMIIIQEQVVFSFFYISFYLSIHNNVEEYQWTQLSEYVKEAWHDRAKMWPRIDIIENTRIDKLNVKQ